jgi:hypothetical protein
MFGLMWTKVLMKIEVSFSTSFWTVLKLKSKKWKDRELSNKRMKKKECNGWYNMPAGILDQDGFSLPRAVSLSPPKWKRERERETSLRESMRDPKRGPTAWFHETLTACRTFSYKDLSRLLSQPQQSLLFLYLSFSWGWRRRDDFLFFIHRPAPKDRERPVKGLWMKGLGI